MRILTGILSPYYKERFHAAAQVVNVELIEVNPKDLTIIFGKVPVIYDKTGKEVIADAFFIRGTSINYKQYAYLAQALHAKGVISLDSITRFNGYPPTKEMSSIIRGFKDIGPKTYILSNEYIPDSIFPLFMKPIDGKLNRGIKIIKTKEEFLSIEDKDNYIFQEVLDIKQEYRSLVFYTPRKTLILGTIYKKSIGCKGKNPDKQLPVSESEQDRLRTFINFSLDCHFGLYGLDIALTEDKGYRLIEANYAPKWESMQTQVNFSIEERVLYLLKKLYLHEF